MNNPASIAHYLQWSTGRQSNYDVVPQQFRHKFHEHPWFSDDTLTRLIDRQPREELRVFMSRIPCLHRLRGAGGCGGIPNGPVLTEHSCMAANAGMRGAA